MPRRHVKKMSGHHSKVSCKRFGLCHATLSPGPQTQYGEIFYEGAFWFLILTYQFFKRWPIGQNAYV